VRTKRCTEDKGMKIEDWRAQIDEVDNELLRLLNRRARLAARIGGMKSKAGLPLYDPEREQEILARACRANAGPLDERSVARIFRRIMCETRAMQARVLESLPEREREVA
jgi:chorismate mutase